MSIVLNELSWAEDVIQRRELGKKPFETLVRVAKYYTYNGLKRAEVRKQMNAFLLSCEPTASLVAWDETLNRAVKVGTKIKPITLDCVNVTESELERIGALQSKMAQKLAFTLLCVAKYYHAAGINKTYWVSTPDNEIMRMANVSASVKRQCSLFAMLRDDRMIQFSRKVDNTSVRVMFVNDDSPVALRITDYRNLGYQYLKYRGEAYYACENCGLICKCRTGDPRGRPQKYCPECAAKIRVKQNVESVMRGRKK